MKINVLGLGYIGLPTALCFASAGHDVRGYDTSNKKREQLELGKSGTDEPGIDEMLTKLMSTGKFEVIGMLTPADVHLICVPTPLDASKKKADLTAVNTAVKSLKSILKSNDLIVLESTSPIGTTRKIHEELKTCEGVDALNTAYCPERLLPGNILHELSTLDRVIGGIDNVSSIKASKLYEEITSGTCHQTDSETAETVKLAENAFRDTNIAFANELDNICCENGVTTSAVIQLANMHPRVDILEPGIGVGGHCLPIDPLFLLQNSSPERSVIASSRKINDDRPIRIAKKICEIMHLNSLGEVALYGLSYKPNIGDFRGSPAIQIAEILSENLDVKVHLVDPFIQKLQSVNLRSRSNVTLNSSDSNIDGSFRVQLVRHDAFSKKFPKATSSGPDVILDDKLHPFFCGDKF